jgi:pimeloyl-ACP methyl ester carboxylesterase
MNKVLGILLLAFVTGHQAAHAQFSPTPEGGPPLKTTYVRLSNNANAIVVEPVTLDPVRSRILVIATHPEHMNNFNYFTAMALAKMGYRGMMVNYYGPETSYYEFIQPMAAAVKAGRAFPGVEKVVLVGHSSGGSVVTSYQDVAENGAAACQVPERLLKCDSKGLDNLPKADAMVLLDSAAGAPERTDALNPAVDLRYPRARNPELDMFAPQNGFDPKTKSANYSPEFLARFYAAQAAKANTVINDALDRLALIEKGMGDYKDDEPFVVPGAALQVNGARPELADMKLLSHTHAPHTLLKADGTKPTQIIPQVYGPLANADAENRLNSTTISTTVRGYLSFQGLRVTPDYHSTEDNVVGVVWRSTANSIEGNLQGIQVPTLIMSGTCAPHLVLLEIAYDLSAAKDKTIVGLEGANHGLMPCRPEFGDTFKRGFDYVDSWLLQPGRLFSK